jgi:hypothetical protein
MHISSQIVFYCTIFFSVSSKGVLFLCTANTAEEKPLVLAMTTEMIEEEVVDSSQSKMGGPQPVTPLESYGFTEVLLIHMSSIHQNICHIEKTSKMLKLSKIVLVD